MSVYHNKVKNLQKKIFRKSAHFVHFWPKIFKILRIFDFSLSNWICLVLLISKMYNMSVVCGNLWKWHFQAYINCFCPRKMRNWKTQFDQLFSNCHNFGSIAYIKEILFSGRPQRTYLSGKVMKSICITAKILRYFHSKINPIFSPNGGST